jgi:hypothetical protein
MVRLESTACALVLDLDPWGVCFWWIETTEGRRLLGHRDASDVLPRLMDVLRTGTRGLKSAGKGWGWMLNLSEPHARLYARDDAEAGLELVWQDARGASVWSATLDEASRRAWRDRLEGLSM